jgi:hypothetical protein
MINKWGKTNYVTHVHVHVAYRVCIYLFYGTLKGRKSTCMYIYVGIKVYMNIIHYHKCAQVYNIDEMLSSLCTTL